MNSNSTVKRFLILSALLCGIFMLLGTSISDLANAAAPESNGITATVANPEQWVVAYGGSGDDYIYGIKETPDGGFIAVGFHSDGSDTDGRVVKLNSDGSVDWQKRYGGSSDDYFSGVELTGDGGYFVVGQTSSFGAGNVDAWVMKLNGDGSVVWQYTYGGSDLDDVTQMALTDDGGLVFVGETRSFDVGGGDIWVVRLDANGDVVWQRSYGGTAWDNSQSIRATSDGGFIFTTNSYSFGGNESGWVVKLNGDGSIGWQKVYNLQSTDYAIDAQETSDGGFIVAGLVGGFNIADGWVLRLDINGNILWDKTYGTSNSNDALFSVMESSDGRFIVAGNTSSFGAGPRAGWLLILNSDGSVAQERTFGTDGVVGSIGGLQETSDGGFALTGESDAAGDVNGWVLKLDGNGNIADCNLVGASQAIVQDTNTTASPTSATVTVSNLTRTATTVLPEATNTTATTLCQAFGDCQLDLAASHDGAQMTLAYDLYTGPDPVTWINSVNVMGNWFPLWALPLPADTSYQNAISFPFPNFGNVAVFTELVTPQDGIICADYELVNTGAAAASGGMPRIKTVSPELLELQPGE